MEKEEGMQLEHRAPGQFRESVGCYQRGLSGRLIKRSLKEIGQELAESLSAMANADGGTVLLGAEADGEGPGIFSSNKTYNIFMQALEKSAVPPLRFQVTPVEMEGRPLIKFTVDPSPAVHLLRNRKCYLRVGAQNVHISGERIALLKEARFETWHEREVLSKSSLEDLEGNLVADFIGHLGVQEEAEKILHRPYGLIEYREGKALLTRAAAYLFGKDALRWHARPGVEFVRFQGNERGAGNEYNVAERLRIEAPILRLIGEMEGIIETSSSARNLNTPLLPGERHSSMPLPIETIVSREAPLSSGCSTIASRSAAPASFPDLSKSSNYCVRKTSIIPGTL
jgi:predicted HTH transcriptional regulator